MSETGDKYQETFIQWLWETQQFNHQALKTTSGDFIKIEDPGQINHGEGPDFLHARLKIGGMLWHGNIEIHHSENDWYKHSHHLDSNYNGVVLHVFLEHSSKPARTEDGFTPHSLELYHYISKPLYRLILQKEQKGRLPCAGNITVISKEVFHNQIERAHKEYLEYKTDRILQMYPSGKPISEAWKIALAAVVYDTLGISKNRLAMKELYFRLPGQNEFPETYPAFLEFIENRAGRLDPSLWSHTGIRPASRPENRIRQAAAFHFMILHIPFETIVKQGASIWDEIINGTGRNDLPGKQMMQILFATAYLPAQYLLGKLLFSEPLLQEALELWKNSKTKLPEKILKPFKKSGLPYEEYRCVAGLAHQLKRYCLERNCHRCNVFKKSIHS
jgi:hypothetical protein